jgi:hypothetical protein
LSRCASILIRNEQVRPGISLPNFADINLAAGPLTPSRPFDTCQLPASVKARRVVVDRLFADQVIWVVHSGQPWRNARIMVRFIAHILDRLRHRTNVPTKVVEWTNGRKNPLNAVIEPTTLSADLTSAMMWQA